MSHLGNAFAVVLLVSSSTIFGQSSEVSIQSPPPPKYVGRFLKPFHMDKRMVAPAKLTNSPRLESLVRGGNLYLSVQDVIALALENNLDIAVQRYSPFLAREVLRRAEGGGFLRQVDTPWPPARPASARRESASTATDSVAAAGSGRGRRIVSQIGPLRRTWIRVCIRAPACRALHHAVDQHAAESNHGPDAELPAVRHFEYSQQFATGHQRAASHSSTRAACSTVPRRCSTPRSAAISICRSLRTCCRAAAWA